MLQTTLLLGKGLFPGASPEQLAGEAGSSWVTAVLGNRECSDPAHILQDPGSLGWGNSPSKVKQVSSVLKKSIFAMIIL